VEEFKKFISPNVSAHAKLCRGLLIKFVNYRLSLLYHQTCHFVSAIWV